MKAALALVALIGCGAAPTPTSPPAPETSVVSALAAYRQSVLAMNVDASVALMEPDVAVSHGDQPGLVGRDKVEAMLRGFAGYKMQAYTLVAESTTVTGDAAQQHGHWTQDVTAPDGKQLHVSGVFDATWHHDADGTWRIAKMHTQN
ncbi:MAG: nuclear transport factor 2 family protein [Deltaproteobacteria bacterium]